VIRAVFFDWYNTLADYYPPREECQSKSLEELGFEVDQEYIRIGLQKADAFYFKESAVSPIHSRSPEEQLKIYVKYQEMILSEANISAPQELLLKHIGIVRTLYANMRFQLFEDVNSTLASLKKQNYTIGLLTNLRDEMESTCRELGIISYLDFIVNSAEAGADKPNPLIFQMALERAGVNPDEAIHVGDAYEIDVVGARGAGINPVLIDRNDAHIDIADCPRIHDLGELFPLLD